ncbi:MAG: ABC transporter permease [Rectinemataceae bacterium]
MILLRIAFRNIARRWRKNLVIGALIAVGVAIFFVGNAVLESSIGGIKRTFSEQFTGDLSISAKSEQSFSLFGPDIPVIGEYESEPVIINAALIGKSVEKLPGVASLAYVLSSPLLVEAGGARSPGLGLGVMAGEYFRLFTNLDFVLGGPPASGNSDWVVITEERAKEIEKAQGKPVALGDRIQLSLFRNQTFAIRDAALVGVLRYQPSNASLARVVVTDGRLMRELCGYSQIDESPSQGGANPALDAMAAGGGDINSLFSATPPAALAADSGPASQGSGPVSVNDLRKIFSEVRAQAAPPTVLGHDGAWHFILVRTKGDHGAVADAVRSDLAAVDASAQVRDWRGTAGAVAVYVFVMQIVFYIGVGMIAAVVLLLTMNSLVMSVFERTAEIGTMRAIGAQRGFVRGLFVVETLSLAAAAGLAGVVLGSALVSAMDRLPLHFSNQILVLLFGGSSLHPLRSAANMVESFVAAVGLGAVAWIYPVRLALGIQPVRAIQKV